jgi:hypothetical protein
MERIGSGWVPGFTALYGRDRRRIPEHSMQRYGPDWPRYLLATYGTFRIG